MSPIVLFSFVIVYFLILLVVAKVTGKNSTNDSFFIGNRNSNWMLVAFGMVGTLVGLVNLMFLLGDGDMTLIGQQMALALMTTFYGVLLSNLLFKPVAVKLERRTEQRLVLMNMVLQGVSMMSQKRTPAMMRETLNSFMEQHQDEINDGNHRFNK